MGKTIPTSLSPALEMHVMTTEAYGQWVANLRMHRLVPSKTGYLGYTRQGFMLTRKETQMLAESLMDLLNDETFWLEDDEGVVEIDTD